MLPCLCMAGCPQCPRPSPANQAPAEGIDDHQIAQHPREPHQQDHCAQGVVGVVRNIHRWEGDPGSSPSPGCLWRDRETRASHYPIIWNNPENEGLRFPVRKLRLRVAQPLAHTARSGGTTVETQVSPKSSPSSCTVAQRHGASRITYWRLDGQTDTGLTRRDISLGRRQNHPLSAS